MKLLARSLAAGAVALMVLYPRTTEAEDVEDYERQGEWEEEGQRFGAIVVHATLEASPTAPGGWTLVRTWENKSDEVAETTVEERLESAESLEGARVTPAPRTVLTRTQTLKLGPHEKRSIGVFLPANVGPRITEGQRRHAISRARIAAGKYDDDLTYEEFSVSYLRPLAKGETAAKHEDADRVEHPARLPGPPPSPSKAFADDEIDRPEIAAPAPTNAKVAKVAPAGRKAKL